MKYNIIGINHKIRYRMQTYICFGLILIFSSPLTSSALAISTQAQWDEHFNIRFPHQDPLLSTSGANEKGAFAWDGHYWVRAYVMMAKAFGDIKYVQKAQQLIDFFLSQRDDARSERGEIDIAKSPYAAAPAFYIQNRGLPAPCWRSYDTHYQGWRLLLIENAQIVQAIMRYVDLVMSREEFASFQARAQDYMARVEETVHAFDSSFVYDRFDKIPGSYYYPAQDGKHLHSGAVEYNMSAAMGTVLLLLDKCKGGVPEYRRKAQAMIGYFKQNAGIEPDNTYVWYYHPQKPWISLTKSGVEDFNHGHIDVGFCVLAYQCRLGFSHQDMQRFADTVVKRIYRGDGELAWSVDGRQMGEKKNYWPIGFDWIDLCEFDSTILDIARSVYTKHYASPGWSRPFLGWANILYFSRVIKKD